jgi:hypothetical protein
MMTDKSKESKRRKEKHDLDKRLAEEQRLLEERRKENNGYDSWEAWRRSQVEWR